MAVLPFVVQPKRNFETVRLGNEDIGVIEIQRKGYLSVAEKTFVDSVMQGSEGIAQIVQLSNKVAKEHKTTTEKAYAAITQAMGGETSGKLEAIIYSEYGKEIAEISSSMADAIQRRAIAAASILIQTRLNHEWTVEDTMELDPELLMEFSELYDREERREPIEEKKTEEEAAEILGK